MADNDPIITGKINYWCREKHYRHMQNACQEGLKKYGNDPLLKFFYGFSLILEDRDQEGIRELEVLKDMRDLNLAAIMCLIFAHKKSKMVDREAVTALDVKLKDDRKTAGEKGLYYGGLFLFHSGKYDKAREYIDRMLKLNPDSKEGLAIKGWLELLCGREAFSKKAIQFFDKSLSISGHKDLDALFGKAKYLEMRRKFSDALEMFNQAVVLYSNYLPALIEKMKVQLALQDWDQAREVADRCLIVDSDCIQAKRFHILYMLCREGDYAQAAEAIGELKQTMERVEPKNPALFDDFARVFCRICGRNPQVLQNTYYMQEHAVSLNGFSSPFLTELGHELMLQGKLKDAVKCYRNAMKLDETSVEALTGMIRCQLLEGQLKDASDQLEFLHELQQSLGMSAELSYLTAVLDMKKQENPEKIIANLNAAVETHFVGLRNTHLYHEQPKPKKYMSEEDEAMAAVMDDAPPPRHPSSSSSVKHTKASGESITAENVWVKLEQDSTLGLPLGPDYMYHLNPDFLVQVIQDYLQLAPQDPCSKGQPPNPILKRCTQVLDPLTKAVSGLLEALYLMGKVRYLTGEVDIAQSTLHHCLEMDSTYSDAHILMAQIQLHQGNMKAADNSLEIGLSYNFEVRDHPIYHLIKARIWKKSGELDKAAATLQVAMNLPGVRKGAPPSKKKNITISLNDRVSVYLELAEAYRLLDQQHEAAKVMQDAMNDFGGTPEEIRITIANADLALVREDVEGALAMLRAITPDQPYFVEARMKMADIYLVHRKDKKLYASCFRELVDKFPSPHTFILLGDAYLGIQEPEKAIEVYEMALKKNPHDPVLANKIGSALVKTHHYGKAINYYEASLKQGGAPALRLDLAELLLRLRQFEKAEKVLKQALEHDAEGKKSTDLDTMICTTRYLVLLSKVYNKQHRMEDSLLQLTKAAESQGRVLKRAQVEQPDTYPEQKRLAASICKDMAQHAYHQREYNVAIKHYKQALTHTEGDGKETANMDRSSASSLIMLELAKLYLITEDLDAAQHQCMTLLQNDTENDAATIMLADLMFQMHEYDRAMYHFQQLLERSPDHYDALAKLVDLMRRAGKLDEVPKFLELAEKASSRATIDAGFNYCKGLYLWYMGDPNAALKHFNKARKDSDYGQLGMYNMIEICLNPDNEILGGEVFEDPNQERVSSVDNTDALRTAEKLLKEMKPRPGQELRHTLLTNMTLVASKQKQSVETALSSFMEICANEKFKDNVGALYGMAAAYMVLKQTPRARNHLKRIGKNMWNMEDAEDLEKGWLLLSDIYIQNGKFDMANELLKRVLQYNHSCCKAYEYMGFIMEKEQSYKDAAKNYENAWKYGNKNNPNVGYKLGFNYLKAKRYVDAIDICHHVLTAHPNYPKIKKDILDKARQNLRM